MTKKVMEITEVTLNIQKTNPPSLAINCKGIVNTGGWSNGHLIPFIYVMPPADGLYEFDLVANSPTGIATQVLSPITAEEFVWEDFPADVRGVKVYASQNNIVALLEEKREKSTLESDTPFNKVSAEDLEKLKSTSDMCFITNAFIWEDVLHLTVQYGGGCKKHDFQIAWDGTEMESLPPQIALFLIHNNNGDACRAIVTEELQVVLSHQITTDAEITLEGWAKRLNFRIS